MNLFFKFGAKILLHSRFGSDQSLICAKFEFHAKKKSVEIKKRSKKSYALRVVSHLVFTLPILQKKGVSC